MSSAAAIVVNYGSHLLLERNLGGLTTEVTVIVVDNFFDEHERVAVRKLCEQQGWELVEVDGNVGFGEGVNLGAHRAAELGTTSLLLVNPDAVVASETAHALVEHVRTRPRDVVAPRIVDSSGATWFEASEIVLRTGFLRRTPARPDGVDARPWLTGACMAISAALFDEIDGFDAQYFLYWEDVDLSLRAGRAGANLVVRDDLCVTHDEGGTHGHRLGPAKSPLYYRWNARNRLLFAARNLPTGLLLRWLVATPTQSWQILLRGGRRQLVQSPGPLIAIVRGSLDGVGVALRELARRAYSRRRVELAPTAR